MTCHSATQLRGLSMHLTETNPFHGLTCRNHGKEARGSIQLHEKGPDKKHCKGRHIVLVPASCNAFAFCRGMI